MKIVELRKTPLYKEHLALRAKCAPFGGWYMPIQYSGILNERDQCRTKTSLFDTSHMGILSVKGNLEDCGIDYAVTNTLLTQKIGRCSYGFLLTEEGTVIDDLIVYKISDDELMIVINASTVEKDAAAIEMQLKESATLSVLSPKMAKLDLQGPSSRAVLSQLLEVDLAGMKYFSFDTFQFEGAPLLISRTGYTGELGFELYLDASTLVSLWRTLLSFQQVEPAGLGARDLLRLEVGLPLSGTDINESINPLEAGLTAFINFDKKFVGREALLRQKEKGSRRFRIAFETLSRRSARSGHDIFFNGIKTGSVTSGIFSPLKNRGIGIGLVDNLSVAELQTPIQIECGKVMVDAVTVELPFYKNGTARNK